MSLIRYFAFAIAGTSLMLTAQPSLAMKVLNEPPPSSANVSSSGIVERVGTVDAVDFGKKTIVVDKVKYALSTTYIKVHAPTDKPDEKAFQLKAGMQIRFTSLKAAYATLEQVQEIWVTSVGIKPIKK